jgi:AcrR family transcriptional regulator
MNGLRRDAARNQARILAAARQAAGRGDTLTMNAVARAADVGVGTVYRHFATIDELQEAVVWDRFDELDRLLDEPGPDRFDRTVAAHVALLVEDPLFEAATTRLRPALPETAVKRDALIARLGSVLDEARAQGRIRADVEAGTVLLLACGVAHAIRSAALAADSDEAQLLLGIVLRGFHRS